MTPHLLVNRCPMTQRLGRSAGALRGESSNRWRMSLSIHWLSDISSRFASATARLSRSALRVTLTDFLRSAMTQDAIASNTIFHLPFNITLASTILHDRIVESNDNPARQCVAGVAGIFEMRNQ